MTLTVQHRFTLPDGTSPPVLSVMEVKDPEGWDPELEELFMDTVVVSTGPAAVNGYGIPTFTASGSTYLARIEPGTGVVRTSTGGAREVRSTAYLAVPESTRNVHHYQVQFGW